VPKALLEYCPPGARIVDTAPMALDAIEAEFTSAHTGNLEVARLHSGDLSIYSAVAEQTRRLERLGIPYTLTPGVPAFSAAAAVLGRELTVPVPPCPRTKSSPPSRQPARRWLFIWRSSRSTRSPTN
jgi:precorrin-4/cobalt-precorrin-4 C11-methyltransferase